MSSPTLIAPTRYIAAPPAADWQERARASYQATLSQEIDGARRMLAARLRALIGQRVELDDIFVDPAARRATVVVDGVLFHGRREGVTLVRPCAHCGAGAFESAPLLEPTDVGYALSVWQPAHDGCEAEGSPRWTDGE